MRITSYAKFGQVFYCKLASRRIELSSRNKLANDLRDLDIN